MHQPHYFAFLILILAHEILSELRTSFFVKVDDVDGSDQPDGYPVNTLIMERQSDCLLHTAFHPSLLWFLYKKESKECVIGQCWGVHLPEPLGNQHVLYRKRVVQSCSDVKAVSPDAEDGEYWLYPDAPTFLGCPTKIYCYNMSTDTPLELVTLPVTNVGIYPDRSNLFCNGELPYLVLNGAGKDGITRFNKIGINIKTMTVRLWDYTFADVTGRRHPYGFAVDCYSGGAQACSPVGTFNIDTSGTGIIIDPDQTWVKMGGTSHTPSVTRSADGRRIDLLCGGPCGGCKPKDNTLQLHRNPDEGLDA